ncbi:MULTISPECIES: MFS transporter [unclassified Streptomyces]|uniref:MFS transporter n=1 Tax=unclassified Streptomyces TaxID=2593676 RepID=UPI0016615FB3|nr:MULTISPECIES: MFS transporter [unclassified Streptomyces]MBD0707947.1 MFS transporter [Streptomyces sp. CBMA291]MBD0715959.1 MFS transporter [Streptomyces sp. CBMA370]
MPRAIYVLAIGIFAMVTSEFAVGGLMPEMAGALGVTISQIGYLITAFAVAMTAGGPLMTVALARIRPKPALMLLFAVFLVGNVLAAVAPSYTVMVVARVITGIASQAFFGIAISVAVQLSRPEVRGRALAIVLNGLTLGTLLGLPLSTLIGGHFGWRAAFWAVGALTVIAALATMAGVPKLERSNGNGNFRQELAAFKNGRLWLALSTSTLIIGATFAAFSYISPILTEVTGFASGAVPLLLVAYGAATVVGNYVVGRLADKHTITVLLSGLTLNTIFLAAFAVFAHLRAPAVIALMGIGLVGVTMNPAMTVRVQRVGNAGSLVNTVHASCITLGVIIGSSVGGVIINSFGLRATLWLGVGLAILGIASVLPDLGRTKAQPSTESLAEEHVEAVLTS